MTVVVHREGDTFEPTPQKQKHADGARARQRRGEKGAREAHAGRNTPTGTTAHVPLFCPLVRTNIFYSEAFHSPFERGAKPHCDQTVMRLATDDPGVSDDARCCAFVPVRLPESVLCC